MVKPAAIPTMFKTEKSRSQYVKRGQDIQAVAMKVALVFDNKHQCRDTSMFSDQFPIQVQSIYVLNVYTNINRKIQYQYIYLMTEKSRRPF
jgi:hypothetical protein